MPVFCTSGQKARVTFPDGSVGDFDDTPINIECKPIAVGFRIGKIIIDKIIIII
jgi:hypothetical protein